MYFYSRIIRADISSNVKRIYVQLSKFSPHTRPRTAYVMTSRTFLQLIQSVGANRLRNFSDASVVSSSVTQRHPQKRGRRTFLGKDPQP
jgi:hypothetical protein